ncbi:MAG: hypothetical protein H5U01_08980, partial [Clostridia bacterium]|nr:hypothetical protein [Clostridia bacterium]
KRELEPAISNQRDLLEWRLNEADRIEKTQPELARSIREAVITLYGQKEWAQPYVERARQALRSQTAAQESHAAPSPSPVESSPE